MSGVLYGLGFGGFIDGIVLHQILQWHHMVSHVEDYPMTTVAGLEVNTLADGFFHVATWFFVLFGSITAITAWRQGRLAPNWSFHFFGLVLAGWGIFNLVEGVIDHHLLGVHHVRDDVGGPLFLGHRISRARCAPARRWLAAPQARPAIARTAVRSCWVVSPGLHSSP